MRLSSLSTEWVRVPVSAVEEGQVVDPTLNTTVEMAFLGDGVDPGQTDWRAAEWETGAEYFARCLVGTANGGTGALAKGKYFVFLKISGSGIAPEAPVLRTNARMEVY